MRRVGFALLMALLLALAGCDSLGGGDSAETRVCEARRAGENYPATLTALSGAEIANRTNAFHRESDGQICSGLDAFGLTSGDGCITPGETSDETLDRESAVTLAKQELAAYQRYTNVDAASALRVGRADLLQGESLWRVTFRDQVYKGRRVRNTDILVWLSANGIFRISGHWYREIVFPQEYISRKEALQCAIGHEVSYYDWTGSHTLRVLEESLPPADSVEMSVLPHRVKDELQLRVVWEFELSDSFFRLYIDAARGKVVDTDQLVVF